MENTKYKYCISKKQEKMKYIDPILTKMTRLLSTVFASLLMLGYVTSCSEQDTAGTATAEEAYLNLSFSTSAPTVTRADGGTLGNDDTNANPTTESNIHSIKVWVFKSGSGDDALPLSYKEDQPTAVNDSYTLSLRILRKVGNEDLENIDLYILTNSESTNLGDNLGNKSMKTVTRKELQDLTFSSPFGITDEGKAETTEVPEKGLPVSRAITNISVTEHVAETETEAANKPISIPLVRAVSKLHFYFARKENANTDQVKVTKIEINGNTFPVNGFAFPDEEDYSNVTANKDATSSKYTETSQYVSTALTLGGVENSSIKEVADPTTYERSTDETAQTYMNRLNNDLGGHDLCYLKETNKSIKGKIYYQLYNGSTEKSAEFTIPSDGNAIRNRELVVYGYFLEGGGSLFLDWQTLPWNDGGSYTYKDAISIKTNVEKTNENGDKIAFNNATYGPKISFTDMNTNGKSWVLQTDSPDYGFVYASKVKADGSYDLTDVLTVIQGTSSTTSVEAFYVVPKSELDYTVRDNYTCHVWMIAYSPNQKVIINAPADGGEGTAITGTPTEMVFTQVK